MSPRRRRGRKNDQRDMRSEKLSIAKLEDEKFYEVCKTADLIFLSAAAQVAELLEIKDYEVDDDESARRIAKEHPALLAGFMYAISSVYSAREGQGTNQSSAWKHSHLN